MLLNQIWPHPQINARALVTTSLTMTVLLWLSTRSLRFDLSRRARVRAPSRSFEARRSTPAREPFDWPEPELSEGPARGLFGPSSGIATSTAGAVDKPPTGRGRISRLRPSIHSLLALAITVGVAAAWFTTLHPQALGGPAGYLIVGGASMEPMLHTGDLAVTIRQSEYRVGDVVVYTVPAGNLASGQRIIHRIVAIDGDHFVVRGDNVNGPDLWRPGMADIEGRLSFSIPGAGYTAVFLRSPAFIAALCAAAAVVYLLRPRRDLGPGTVRPLAYA